MKGNKQGGEESSLSSATSTLTRWIIWLINLNFNFNLNNQFAENMHNFKFNLTSMSFVKCEN